MRKSALPENHFTLDRDERNLQPKKMARADDFERALEDYGGDGSLKPSSTKRTCEHPPALQQIEKRLPKGPFH